MSYQTDVTNFAVLPKDIKTTYVYRFERLFEQILDSMEVLKLNPSSQAFLRLFL